MMEKLITLIVGLLMALGGWTLTRTFDLSTKQVVNTEKVAKLERQVEKLTDELDEMKDLDEEIMEQHEDFIKALEGSKKSYSYGD
jgi:vacuolar-type H+-ATPase subunit I/STV1